MSQITTSKTDGGFQSTFPQIEGKIKSYWSRPGGKFGTILGLGVLGFLAFQLWQHVLPSLLTVVSDTTELFWGITKGTLMFGAMAFVVASVGYVVLNPNFRKALFYLYEIGIRKFVGIVIETDPITIAKLKIEELKQEKENLFEKIGVVEGTLEKTKRKIDENASDVKANLDLASKANQQGDSLKAGAFSSKAARKQNFNGRLIPLKNGLEKMAKYLNDVYKKSGFMIDDMEDDVKTTVDMYQYVGEAHNAFNSVLKIFKGDVQSALFADQAMEYMKDNISMKLGDIRQTMKFSEEFLDKIDLEQAVFEEKGLQMLDQYTNNKFEYERVLTGGANVNPVQLNASTFNVKSTVSADKKYSDLL